MSDDVHDRRRLPAVMALLAVIAALIAWDLLLDYGEGADWRHVSIELAVLAAAGAGLVLLWGRLERTRSDLAAARDRAEEWQRQNRELVRGLGIAIENQFAQWGLTRAESEVGLLLLKGLSHKEIAAVRDTSERTIREQARAVYRKSGLSGRSALSAFFLEDLLVPGEPRE
ncbi:MAG TPA: LuxR C-terminal-related transcriptional regulator [Woeseiaceae bacterium]|nr:LuxR C-terminal-related transcriptional regulator [Woeseiaceae bacterium]